MNCETSAITIAASMLPEARKAETMQSCTPMPPQARHMMRMNCAPSAMTSGARGTKNATSAGAKDIGEQPDQRENDKAGAGAEQRHARGALRDSARPCSG